MAVARDGQLMALVLGRQLAHLGVSVEQITFASKGKNPNCDDYIVCVINI